MERKNTEFEFRGINHLALVCRDMERTVDFYSNVLGMPLIKTIELPNNMGQHFFFDIGNGNALAFFDFPGLDLGPYAEVLGQLHEQVRSQAASTRAIIPGTPRSPLPPCRECRTPC